MLRLLIAALAALAMGAFAPPSKTDVVLRQMLRLPAWREDAELPPEEREAFLRPVAAAIAKATRTREEASALLSLGWYESRFARYVVEGRCHDGPKGARCDMDHKGVPRARGPWQVWRWCHESWKPADGSVESLEGGARCAVRLLRGSRLRCPDNGWIGAFSGYAGIGCERPSAPARVALMDKILKRW